MASTISAKAMFYLGRLTAGKLEFTDIPVQYQKEILRSAGVDANDSAKQVQQKFTAYVHEVYPEGQGENYNLSPGAGNSNSGGAYAGGDGNNGAGNGNNPFGAGGSGGGDGPGGGEGGGDGGPAGAANAAKVDDYLNSAESAGYDINDHIKALAEEAAQKGWADWEWSEALKDTKQGKGSGSGSKQTADDYLNALPAGVEVNAHIKALADQAAKEQWADWQWAEKVGNTKQAEHAEADTFLGSIPAGVPITPEIRKLAEEAAKKGWDSFEFQDALMKTKSYVRSQSAQFENSLSSWGIPMDGNLKQLISESVRKGWNQDQYLQYLRKTPEYRDAFPGIFDKDGTLQMSEDAYLTLKDNYVEAAQVAGINLGDKKTAFLFRHDVSLSEATARFTAERRLKDNPELFKQFAAQLQKSGNAPKGGVTEDHLFQFVMGQAPAAWYKEWQGAVTRYQAVEAGIKIAKGTGLYTSLGGKEIQKIANKGLSEAEMTAKFQETAKNLLTTLPLSRIQGYGLTRNQIAEASFGGPHQARIQALMEHIQATDKAFDQEPRGVSSISGTAGGHTGIEGGVTGQ